MSTSVAEELDTETELVDDKNQPINPLDISDEDFVELSLEELNNLPLATDDNESNDDNEDAETNDEDDDDDGLDDDGREAGLDGESGRDTDNDGDTGGSDGGDGGNSSEDDGTGDSDTRGRAADPHSDTPSKTAKASTEAGDIKGSVTKDAEGEQGKQIDYEAEHKKLLAPFRANNRDMNIENVEDARTLMQMGANYNKKMAGLKPNLKIVKMLENNNLLDEQRLSFLIDLDKKDPEAIKKFIKESGIDPLELDLEAENKYESKTYNVDDKEVELDGVLDDIKDTPGFNDTIDIISNKWDESSKQVLVDNPNIIKVINEHVGNGIYAKIEQEISQQRMLGKLNGVSDLDAYRRIGDEINTAGGFASDSDTSSSTASNTQKKTKTVDPKLRDRKKAASSTKSAVSKSKSEDFNPLSMSDEAIEKMGDSKFL